MLPTLGTLIANRYRLNAEVGRGGMQQVWAARDLSLERDVAIKTPLTSGAQKRFADTARLSARVRHANVAAALDYIVEGDTEFYVEELVDGINLQDCMSHYYNFLDADTCARVLHRLAKGVAASHNVQVVHRDLKPSNIIVSRDLGFGTVKITDFGIAKLAGKQIDSETEVINRTSNTVGASSTMLGAIPFLPPEVLRKGRPGAPAIGTAADVWSLGAIGYWLLSGELPFGEGFEAVASILLGQPKPWGDHVTEARQTAKLSRELMAIVDSCLVRDPEARPDANTLAQQIAALGYLSGHRQLGTVARRGPYGGVWFSLGDNGLDAMTHQKEVVGPGVLSVGTRVSYTAYPGNPDPRAVAIMCLKTRT